MKILVTGAGGFIGGHLARHLKEQGYWVRGVDLKHPEWSESVADEFKILDLRHPLDAAWAMGGVDRVFALAADMGGIGYISNPKYQGYLLTNNTTINMNSLEAASIFGINRYLFTSSVCIYPCHRLQIPNPPLMAEEDARPANPGESYGWEKLNTEHLCRYYRADGLETRIVRLETTYGPEETWQGGKEKVIAALCRKVAMAKLKGEDSIEIWGDGETRRTFMYVDDCVRGLVTVMESDCQEPVNLGPDDSVSIDELADLIMETAGVELKKVYVEGPQGARGRNFSHERAKSLEWEARVPLREGIAKTYEWIEGEVEKILIGGENGRL